MTKEDTLNVFTKIISFDPSARFVGSSVLNYHEIEQANDVDVLTDNIDLYDDFLVEKWNNPTPFNANGKRGTARINGIRIDLFEISDQEDINEYEVVDGIKMQTMFSLLKFHQSLIREYLKKPYSLTRDIMIEKHQEKIEALQNMIFL